MTAAAADGVGNVSAASDPVVLTVVCPDLLARTGPRGGAPMAVLGVLLPGVGAALTVTARAMPRRG